jgi:hypothetical protein
MLPRRGVFASWGNGPSNPVLGNAKVELVFPGGAHGIRKRLVSAELIPLAAYGRSSATAGGRE